MEELDLTASKFASLVTAILFFLVADNRVPAHELDENLVDQRHLGKFETWTVTRYRDASDSFNPASTFVCWISSAPTKSESDVFGRGDVYFLVFDHPAAFNTKIGVHMGYMLAGASDVRLEFENKTLETFRSFAMFADGDTAWAYDSDIREIENQMSNAATIVIRGTSWIGASTVDRYSLSGFADATLAVSEFTVGQGEWWLCPE